MPQQENSGFLLKGACPLLGFTKKIANDVAVKGRIEKFLGKNSFLGSREDKENELICLAEGGNVMAEGGATQDAEK